MPRSTLLAVSLFFQLAVAANAAEPAGMIDLSNAVLNLGPGIDPAKGAVPLLQVEIQARTGLSWSKTIVDWPDAGDRPVIAIGLEAKGVEWTGPFVDRLEDAGRVKGAEGFRIAVDVKTSSVIVLGNDARGALFGVGRLLRELRLGPGKALLPNDFHAAEAPKLAIRGHQLGYRPKTNSYDAWDRAQWFRYIRELAVFGTNTIELVPPRTDDAASSPHFPLPPLKMMAEMANICAILDLDVSIWFPVMDPIDSDPSKVEGLLKEWDEVFRALRRVDSVFVPGGDPGHVGPKPLLAFLEQAAHVLHQSHPRAEMWVSPQGFDAARMEEFLAIVKTEPVWLKGLVYGPQVRMPLDELRRAVPPKIAIRGYPDITHSRQCQHPVPDWDLAYALTEGREIVNPRPLAEAAIAKEYAKETVGFISYSEGCNDDVNKFVWSGLGWNPEADVAQVLRQYGRYLIAETHADALAQSMLALERNWNGPLLTNAGVETTLRSLQALEREANPALAANWRFQQLLYRGYYDAYIRDRLIEETALESKALDTLRDARRLSSDLAIHEATATFERALTHPVAASRRTRIFALGEALFQSVRMQLDVEHYKAIEAERGANLDTIDAPLNNRVWLASEFATILGLKTELERLRAIDALLDRANPGPGGFYDALGDPCQRRHLVVEPGVAKDPLLLQTPFTGFALRDDWPTFWKRYAYTLYDAPLRLHYDRLDPIGQYKLRVIYAGDNFGAKMACEGDGKPVHPLLAKPNPPRPLEFDIPQSATSDGRLTLTWTRDPGQGGNGRGCQVAEVWLIRK